MGEIICTYDIKNPDLLIPYEREKFYDEQYVKGNIGLLPTKYAAVVNAILFDTEGRLLLQKRSNTCKSNPGLLTKTVGGHIEYPSTPDFTIEKESMEEVGINVLLSKKGLFEEELKKNLPDIANIAILRKVQTINNIVNRIVNDVEYKVGIKETSYIGVYGGEFNFNDGEVSNMYRKHLDVVIKESCTNKDLYTYSFIEYILNNEEYIRNFIERIKEIINNK